MTDTVPILEWFPIARRATTDFRLRGPTAACSFCGHSLAMIPASVKTAYKCTKCVGVPSVTVCGQSLPIAEYSRQGRLVTIRAVLPEHMGLEGVTCDLIDDFEGL